MNISFRENIKDLFYLILLCGVFAFAVWWHLLPDYEERRYRTGPEVMAERWSHPEPNDPNFLADYKKYIGYEWREEEDK